MDLIGDLALGFSVAFTWEALALCMVGCLVGTLIGVIPGIGPSAALAMLLPVTAYLSPTGALIMLAGIYYGAQYGGSTTAILVNMPGESSSLVTCIDGHQMARRGRAGAALAIAALGSFIAGTACTMLIALAARPLAQVALAMGATEYFSLMFLGLVGAVVFARGSLLKGVGMMLLGIGMGMVGQDPNSALPRYSFGLIDLADGIGFVPITLGMLGVAEIIANLEQRHRETHVMAAIGRLWPTRAEWRAAWPAILRGTGIGAILGIMPGIGATLSSFAAYAAEKGIARDRSTFGRGAVQGLAGPESANNAAAQTSFIPMLTLGIPSGTIMALMIGALMIQGIQPGPRMMTNQAPLFWGVIASMWVGNAMLLVINLPMVGLWVRLLAIPYRLLFPGIVLVCAIGAFSINNSSFEVAMVALFALLGCLGRKIGLEVAPLAIGYILGPMMEENFRRAMLLAGGDMTVFVTQPISAGLLLCAALLVVVILLPGIRRGREVALEQEA